MDYGPLVKDEIESAAVFLREFNQYKPIKVAFWLKPAGPDELRYLHIASDQIGSVDIRNAYGEVNRIATELKLPDFDQFRVKILRRDDRMAKDAAELNEKWPDRTSHRFHFRMFGDTFADDAYVYPPFHPAPAAAAAAP